MAIIGKNVIENLTTAMYENLQIIYREYIQNAADSIDQAIRQGIITPEKADIDITISSAESRISVRDNGTGIQSKDFMRIMSSIADSTKDRTETKGFRGIGRLGGISSCNELKFTTSAFGESKVSVFTWDAKKVREILVDKKQNPTASELVDMVTNGSVHEGSADEHFFEVEMLGITDNASELLDEKAVKSYLQAVAPIPYAEGFIYESKIKEFARENGFRIDEYQVFVNGERLHKPYKTYFCDNGNVYDELIDVEPVITRNHSGEILSWMWYGISKFERQIPSCNKMRGIRLRKDNIQIGDENTFTSHDFYKESRGGLYFVGEVFAVHPDLIPNARRDYFNLNEMCREFESQLHGLFYDRFYKIYHAASQNRSALRAQKKFENAQQSFEEKSTQGRFLNPHDKESAKRELDVLEEKAAEKRRLIENRKGAAEREQDSVLAKIYAGQEKSYAASHKESETKTAPKGKTTSSQKKKPKFMTDSLSQLNRAERKLIGRVYEIIQAVLPPDTAETLINKIQEELSKKK